MMDTELTASPHGSMTGPASLPGLFDVALSHPSHPSRRQSDSVSERLSRRERIGRQDDDRAKLRLWAAEALAAPPPLLEPCESEEAGPSKLKVASLGRRHRPRSKSPPASSRFDSELLYTRRKSLFAPQQSNLGSVQSSLDDTEESSRVFATATSASQLAIQPHLPSSTHMVSSASSPADTHKGLAQRRLESGQLDIKLLRSMSKSPKTTSKSQRASTPIDSISSSTATVMGDEATPRPRPAHSPRELLPRLVTLKSSGPPQKMVRVEDPATPRALPSHTDSPRSTTSNCESDEDDVFVETPLDGGRLSPVGAIACHRGGLSMSSTNDTPPLDTLTDAPAARLGGNLDLENMVESPIATYLGQARRGSSSFAAGRRPSLAESGSLEDQPIRAEASISAPSMVPTLSKSTLLDLGAVRGLTPPAPAHAHPGSNTGADASTSSSVVSAGLEMGLGVSMATAALSANMPVRGSGLSHFAEPRHGHYPSISLSSMNPYALAPSVGVPRLTQKELTPEPYTSVNADVPGPSIKGELDLSRRKTTGWDAGKARRDLAKRHRAETQDATMSHIALRNAQQHHTQQQTKSNTSSSAIPQAFSSLGDGLTTLSLLPHDASDALRGGASSTRSSFDSRETYARASRTGSTQLDTPSLSGRAMLSPDVNPLVDMRNCAGGVGLPDEDERITKARQTLLREAANGGQASFGANGGLMGSNVGGHFGPGVRAKVINVLGPLISGVPISRSLGETVHLAEFGCLNSRSIPLMQLVISKFARRASAMSSGTSRDISTVVEEGRTASHESSFDSKDIPDSFASRHLEQQSSPVNFTVIHEDAPTADFRPIIHSLDNRSDSYLDAQWQSSHRPTLQDCVFSSFVGRPFASRIVPPNTLHFGISLMDLHWLHTPPNNAVPLATSSHAELVTFLKARANEFKPGGVLMVAFLARSDPESHHTSVLPARKSASAKTTSSDTPRGASTASSQVESSSPGAGNSSRKATDIWTKLQNTLAPCIQRLVSCGMLKSDVARHLLDLPLHPRTPRQAQTALSSLRHLWKLEWSCGLGEGPDTSVHDQTTSSAGAPPVSSDGGSERHQLPPSEAQPMSISHPAWKAYRAGTLSKVALTEHLLMLYKNLYEVHFRNVLRERGKLSKGAVEFVLDSLWDILTSKIDDQEPNSGMEEIEIEVSTFALRRL